MISAKLYRNRLRLLVRNKMGRQPIFKFQPKPNGLLKKVEEKNMITNSNTGLIVKGECE